MSTAPCNDPLSLFEDDFEDPSRLSADWLLVADTTNTAGVGVSGTRGMRAGSYGQMSTAPGGAYFEDVTAIPGSGQKVFCETGGFYAAWGAAGGCWKINNFQGAGFWLMEVRFGTGTAVSLYVEEGGGPFGASFPPGDIVAYKGVTSEELFRATNVFPNDTDFVRVELKWRLSQYSGTGSTYLPNGSLELRVGGTVVGCVHNTDRARGGNGTAGSPIWDNVDFGHMGDLDNIYVNNGWYCGEGGAAPGGGGGGGGIIPDTGQTVTESCCGSGGPSGTFTTTSYTPSTPSISSHSGAGPVLVASGGLTPDDYVACTGGGTPPTASDPTDAQSLENITTPRIFVDINLPDTTVKRLAQETLGTEGDTAREQRIVKYSTIQTRVGNHLGSFPTQAIKLVIDDHDRFYRDLSNMRNQQVSFYAESEAARKAGTAPVKLASTLVRYASGTENFMYEMEVSDRFDVKEGPLAFNRSLPDVVIGDVFDAIPEEWSDSLTGHPIPFYFGEYSDEAKWDENPKRVPVGIVPWIGPVGPPESYGGSLYHPYVICRFASTDMPAVFGSNEFDGTGGAGSVRLDPEDNDILVPFTSKWTSNHGSANYVDVAGANGTTYRLTMAYAKGRLADDHNTGTVPITCNLCGIEDTGDGTGTLIDDAAEVLYFFFNYLALGSHTTGTYGAVPTDADGVAITNRASFAAVKAIHDSRLVQGYPVAWAVRERRTAKSYVNEFCRSTGIRPAIGRQQIEIHTLDDQQSSISSLTVIDESDINMGSFRVDKTSEEDIINQISFVYGPEPSTGRFTHGFTTIKNTGSVTAIGDTHESPDLELHAVRDPEVAQDVMARMLLWLINAPALGSFDTDLGAATKLQLGQLVRLTSRHGLSSTGWTDRVVMILGLDFHVNSKGRRTTHRVNTKEFACTVHFADTHRQIVRSASLPGGGSTISVIGYQPIGTDGIDAFTMGTSGDDAYRMGYTGL